ncbi:MAG TPA: hypothetical protein VK846_13825 [Candidatus Limnocylindria bacterium]|nr:hypothetical protein [Candidatus Limnocylindria bacterium]
MNTDLESPTAGNGTIQSSINPSQAQPDGDVNAEIVPANLRALEGVYFAAMLEEARIFDVVDRLVAMFSQGLLPLGPGKAGATLYRYWKGHHNRLTAAQRHDVYARAFGLPGGEASGMFNCKFNDLWLRFVSIVGMYSAELQMLPPEERSVGPEEVLVSGRDLAINLSAHGHGLAWFAAQDFKPEIQQIIELLSDSEIQTAFQARDPWQVIQNVAAFELGARPNVQRGHTRGESGVIIIRWLANRRARLLRPRGNILKHDDICEGRTAASQNKKATVYPTDSDLVTACEQWLGVTGTQEAEIKEQAPLDEPAPAEPPASQQDEQREQAA